MHMVVRSFADNDGQCNNLLRPDGHTIGVWTPLMCEAYSGSLQ